MQPSIFRPDTYFRLFCLIFCANSRILHPLFEISNQGTVIVYDKDLGKSLDKYIEYRALCSMHKWVVFLMFLHLVRFSVKINAFKPTSSLCCVR